MRKVSFILILLFFLIDLNAEEITKHPMKAAGLSLILPGGGQVYNQNYWKAGLVAGVELGLTGLFVYHHLEAEKYYDDFEQSLSQEDYTKYTDSYYKRQNALWWLGITIFLSTIDAYVDAHLFDFEEKKQKIQLKFEDKALSLSYKF